MGSYNLRNRRIWSPIHRELGLPASDSIDFDMIEQAVKKKLRESSDLEFKRDGYPAHDRKKRDELAKDLCAMANAEGGWILCGVATGDDEDTASEIVPIPIDKNIEQRIRDVATVLIAPPLLNIEIHHIVVDAEHRIYAIEVPPSTTKPHLVNGGKGDSKHSFYVPIRYGSDTRYAEEPELRRMYSDTFREQNDRSAQFQKFYEEYAEYAEHYEGLTFVLSAYPERDVQFELSPEILRKVLSGIDFARFQGNPKANWLLHPQAQLQRGDRSWVLRDEAKRGRQKYWRLEISENGGMRCAIRLGGWNLDDNWHGQYPLGQPNTTTPTFIEDALLESFTVLCVLQESLFNVGYHILSGLSSSNGQPIEIKPVDAYLEEIDDDSSEDSSIYHFHPAEGHLEVGSEESEQLKLLIQLEQDIVNQAGIQHMYHIKQQ